MTLSEAFSSRPFADGSENAATRTLEPRRASGSGSRIWGAEAVQDVAPVSMTGVRQVESGGFRSLYTSVPGQHTATMRHGVIEMEPEADPLEEARLEAFTMGFDEGCRVTAQTHADASEAHERLTQALEMLSPAPSGMLSTMLSATVVDPMADDAKRRGWLEEDASAADVLLRDKAFRWGDRQWAQWHLDNDSSDEEDEEMGEVDPFSEENVPSPKQRNRQAIRDLFKRRFKKDAPTRATFQSKLFGDLTSYLRACIIRNVYP